MQLFRNFLNWIFKSTPPLQTYESKARSCHAFSIMNHSLQKDSPSSSFQHEEQISMDKQGGILLVVKFHLFITIFYFQANRTLF